MRAEQVERRAMDLGVHCVWSVVRRAWCMGKNGQYAVERDNDRAYDAIERLAGLAAW